MQKYRLTKQSGKKLKKLQKSDIKLANQIANHIKDLRLGKIQGETMKEHTDYKKIRVRHFRIIYTYIENDILLIAVIDKRETVYGTFEKLLKNSDQFN